MGRLRYEAEAAKPGETSALLRRATHRLEKGLLMRPLRGVFAIDYIEATIDCYESILTDQKACDNFSQDELKWAFDVLTDYFSVTNSHPKIDRCRNQFQKLPHPLSDRQQRFVPYRRDLSCAPSVSFDAIYELARRRRSVRWFLQKPVPREFIEKAITVAAQSPSACNRQPFVFRVFDNPVLAREVGGIPFGTSGFSENFPAVVVLVGQQRNYFDERDRHVIYIDASLAAMSFVYALETLGLSSCCINWPDIEEREREMERILKLEPDERPIMLIALGYPDPDGLVAYSQKKPVSQLCRYNYE